jgi:hypothetical protein
MFNDSWVSRNPQPLRVSARGARAPLVKADSNHWLDETYKALDELKALITKLPVLASPEPGETLLLYMVATTQDINTAVVVEQEELGHVYKVQWSVYNISKVLTDCETLYN